MKKILFLGLLLVVTLVMVSCVPRGETADNKGALAGEAVTYGSQSSAGSVARGAAPLATKLISAQAKITKIGRDTCGIGKDIFGMKCVDTAKLTKVAKTVSKTLESCSMEPSCGSSNYEVTATDCTTWRPIESCYICSVKDEVKSRALCAEGWGSTDITLSWTSNAFNCYSDCFQDCGRIPGEEERDPECVSSCSLPTSLERPCPEGFTFYDWSADYDPYGFAYACLLPGVSDIFSPVCNQCGSDVLFDTGQGDIHCAVRS